MMNVLALSLVVSSLAVAGVWSPTQPQPQPQPQRDDVIVKDGHRVVVVEYDEDGHRNTKVSISPSPTPLRNDQYFSKETIKETASALPNLGQGISPEGKTGFGIGRSPRELICDAFGKCTPRITNAFGKAKDKVSETAHDAKEKVSETAHAAKEKFSETAQEVRERVSETANEAKEKVAAPKRWISHETQDKVPETARQTKAAVGDALGKAKDTVVHKGKDVKENAEESIDKAKDTVNTAKDTVGGGLGKAKEGVLKKGQDVKGSAEESIDNAKDTVKETAKTVGDHIVANVTEQANTGKKAMEEAKENTERAAKRAKTSGHKFFNWLKHITSMEALNSLMVVANLLGLATAYGMSVWVTFISSYVLAGVLPRQQFGVVQSKIYPVYFRAMAYSIGLALLGHTLGQRRKTLFSSKPEMFQAFNLLSSLLMVLANALYLEPNATKVMFERMKMEKEEGRGRDDLFAEGSKATEPPKISDPADAKTRESAAPTPSSSEQEVVKSRIARLNERLKKLNTNSSLLNVLTLMALSWHLVFLAQRLSFKC